MNALSQLSVIHAVERRTYIHIYIHACISGTRLLTIEQLKGGMSPTEAVGDLVDATTQVCTCFSAVVAFVMI